MSRGKGIEYVDDGESSVEANGRIELTHFRQDPPIDFTDPTEAIVTKPGSRRRTTITRKPLVEGGPRWKSGRRTGWYVQIDITTGEHKLVSVESADELANLPQDALEAGEYYNLLAEENPSLAASLVDFLGGASDPHTAHYTRGSDYGQRTILIFARDQLAYQKYQDPQIGGGIVIPEIRHRPKDPSTVVGDDNIEW